METSTSSPSPDVSIRKQILSFNNPGQSSSVEEDVILTKCFFNWITKDAPLEPKEAKGIAAGISNKFMTSNLAQQLRISPVVTISKQLCLAFFHLILNKYEEAGKNLKDAANLIKEASENELISKDYVQGLTYLTSDLETSEKSFLLESAGVDKDECLKYLKSSPNPQSLSPLAREVIMGVRAVFLGSRGQREEEIKVLRCLNSVNSQNIEWPLGLHIALRTYRKNKIHRGAPCREEKDAILRAIQLNREHIYSKLQVCMYLSDVIRHRDYTQNSLLFLGEYGEFRSVQKAAEHVTQICNNILMTEEYTNLPMVNLTIADIVGFGLPFKYRDIEVAKGCLRGVLLQNPKSSKANHRMGILLLSNPGDPEKALPYIKIAFENNHANIAALMDIIQILLSKPEENASELNSLFEEYVNQNGLKRCPQFRRSSLLFTKGIYHFMRKEKEVALQTWIEAYKIDSSCIHTQFTEISNQCQRYKWEDVLHVSELWEYLKNDQEEIPRTADDLNIISALTTTLSKAYMKTPLNIGGASGDGTPAREKFPNYGRGTVLVKPCISGDIDNWRSENLESGGNQGVPQSRTRMSYRNSRQNVNAIRDPIGPGADGGRGFKTPVEGNWRET